MAVMIPADCDKTVRPQSEQRVFDALQKGLDDSWTVFHSFDYIARNLNKSRWEGEIDFLLHHPEHGLLVLEVKGGRITYRDGVWYQNDHVTDPFAQARKNKYAVLSLFDKAMGLPPKTPVGIKVANAVCFPDCAAHPSWPSEADGIVATGDTLPQLQTFAVKVMAETNLPQGAENYKVTPELVNKVLRPCFDYGARLCDRLAAEERQCFALTEAQCALLDALDNFTRLAVQGCAGSGKTVMAVKKAISLAAQGKSVLLLCYNQLLAEHLRKATAQHPNITATAFFDFAIQALGVTAAEAGAMRQTPDFWHHELPKRLLAYLQVASQPRFDAILVDEGQDFSADSWRAIEAMLSGNGHLYLFYDPGQNLFHPRLELPAMPCPPIVLNKNCRNTKRIFAAIQSHGACPPGMGIFGAAPEGAEVREYVEAYPEKRRAKLEEVLTQLIAEEKIAPEDIVVLGGHSMPKTCIANRAKLGKFRLVTTPPRTNCEIYYCTYMKFKGCESRAVILLDVNAKDPRWQNGNALYTAMSRARNLLVIISKLP